MTVNTLRKQCHNDEVVSLAKALIKSWKKLLTGTVMLILIQVTYLLIKRKRIADYDYSEIMVMLILCLYGI